MIFWLSVEDVRQDMLFWIGAEDDDTGPMSDRVSGRGLVFVFTHSAMRFLGCGRLV